MNDLEQAIYDNVINIILANFKEDEQEEIKNAYKNYLIKVYRSLYDPNRNIEQLKNSFTKTEILTWKNKSKEFIQRGLLKDEYLDKIYDISQMAYKFANYRKMNNIDQINITKDQVDNYINLMNEYLKKVKSYNEKLALQYVSEGSIDFYYALGLVTATSFRLK